MFGTAQSQSPLPSTQQSTPQQVNQPVATNAASTQYGSGHPQLILPGDYADPSILRDGNNFYMTHSPFSYMPGFLIWHSTDLVHWEPVVRAMTGFRGAMAPDLVKVNGRYYIYFPADGWNWVITADKISGPWSKPLKFEVNHIDPGHVVGEDGKQYLYVSGGIRVRLSDDGLKVEGAPEKVYEGWQYPKEWKTECFCLESPKFFHHGDYIYMISAEGGTAGPATSHMAVVARSKSVNGPWENSPYNPLVHTYLDSEEWWSKGHGTIFEDSKGKWWVVYHGYQKNLLTLGRQTLIEPIQWTKDGWPTLVTPAEPVKQTKPSVTLELSDNFKSSALGLQWFMWHEFTGVKVGENKLQIDAKGSSPTDARVLMTTATDASYEIQTEVELSTGNTSGLLLFYNNRAYAGLTASEGEIKVYSDGTHSTAIANRWGMHFFLKIVNQAERCNYAISADGTKWETLAEGVDVSALNHNNYKGFLALRPALIAAGNGPVTYQHFVYLPL